MDIEKIAQDLKEAHNKYYDPALERQGEIVESEVKMLLKFLGTVWSFTSKKVINEKECVLIYMFEDNDRQLISNDVYLSPDAHITYQVFNKEAYKEIVPDAEIVGGFVRVPISYFLKAVPLIKILKFFEERPQVLINNGFDISTLNDKRLELLKRLDS